MKKRRETSKKGAYYYKFKRRDMRNLRTEWILFQSGCKLK